jgi:hypothetical protein
MNFENCRYIWEPFPSIVGQFEITLEEETHMLKRLFHDHPAKAGESYFEHLAFALGFSWRLIRAGLAAFVHGLLPACFETTASSEVLAMNDEIRVRRAQLDRPAAIHAAAARTREVHSTS